jgi:hypothetical protein
MAAEPEFAAGLRSLYDAHVLGRGPMAGWADLAEPEMFNQPAAGAGDPVVSAYVAAVRSLAERWGLDRLVDRRGELGARLIDRWCRTPRPTGTDVPVEWLIHSLGEAEYVADIGEVVGRATSDLGDVVVVEERVRPVARIVVIDEWDPLREPRATARKRLRGLADGQILRELDRLASDAEAKGYRFVDTEPALERDLDRLYRLMTKRTTLADLVAASQTGPEVAETDDTALKAEVAVSQSIRRIAKRAGVSTRGWGLRHG